MQSILELFKLEVDYSSTSFHQNYKIAQESLIQQLNQYWDYLSQKSIIHQLCLAKVQDCIGVTYTATQSNTGTISARSQLFIHFVSAKVQDCIGVTYTANQSTLELFQQKCKIAQQLLIQQLNQYWNYSSQKSIIHQLCFTKIARLHRSLPIQQCNQYWNYLSQKLIIHQFHFGKSARLHRSHLYSNSVNTGTI